MKKSFSYSLLSLFILLRSLSAQNENTKWYFGNKAALDFMTDPPTSLNNSAMNVGSGCASIADAAGNLLFYTSGDTIWNKNHQVMANGTGLFGYNSSEGTIIVKKPSSNNLYYIFTVPGGLSTQGLNYSIVDMSLAAGMGSVTIKNSPLYAMQTCQHIAATRHCNGQDFWILSQDKNTDIYRAFLLSASGINTTAVLSTVSTATNGNTTPGFNLRFSPNGKRLCSSFFASPSVSSSVVSYVVVYDFNPGAGIVSNSLCLSNLSNARCEFSPNGSKIYVMNAGVLHQFDLCAGSSSAIIASDYTVNSGFGSMMRRAPNGKIYVAKGGFPFLNVINNPNLQGNAMNYIMNGQSLVSGVCRVGLPNFANGYDKEFASFAQGLGCLSTSFTVPSFASPSLSACVAMGTTVTSLSWNFGDPASGSANTSTLTNPTHTYPAFGNYTVQLVINYVGCAPDTIRQTVQLVNPSLSINTPSFSCNGSINATVVPNGGSGQYTYTWMPGNINTATVSNVNPGTYTVSVSDALGNCFYSNTVTLTSPSTLSANITTTLSCTTVSASILSSGGSGNYTYSWSPGSYTSATVNTLPPGSYTVVTNDVTHQCSITNTVLVSTLASPTLAVSGNYTVCPNQSATLSVSGADTYTWSTVATGSLVVLSPTVTTSYIVSGSFTSSGCVTNKTVSVIVSQCLGLDNKNETQPVTIYPNPNYGSLTIESPFDLRVKLFDALGKMILEDFLKSGKQNLDLKIYPSGVYILEIISEEMVRRQRIIKEY